MFMVIRNGSKRRNRPVGADDTSRQTPFAKRGLTGPTQAPTFLDRPAGRLLVYLGIMAFCAACWAGCVYGVFR